MKISVAKENLAQAVNAISGIVPSKSPIPILYNILLEAEESVLKLSGTDLDISLRYQIPATVEKAGSITLPARKLGEIVRALPNSPIFIEQVDGRVNITCEKTKYLIPGMPKEDYPVFPDKSFENAMKISNSTIRKLVARTGYAAGRDDSRPILKGILWEISPGESSMVSTNGHRLSKMIYKEPMGLEDKVSVVVPPKALEMVEKLCSEEGELEVVIDENHLGMRENDVVIFSRLIEGSYPNYEQVIPFHNKKTALIDQETLSNALGRMLILSNTMTHRVRMFFKENRLKISVSTEEFGEGEETIEIDYTSEELEIYFNGTYLIDVIKYIESEQVKMCMETSESGILIVPESEREEEKYICVIMPLKVTE